mgnify:CR=1 FL=1
MMVLSDGIFAKWLAGHILTKSLLTRYTRWRTCESVVRSMNLETTSRPAV